MKKARQAKSLIIIIVLALFLGIGLFVVTRKGGGLFDLRNRASGTTGNAHITLQPDAPTYYIGDTFPIDVYFSTGASPISGAAFRLMYNDAGIVSIVDQDTSKAGVQIKDFAATSLNSSFATPVNQAQLQSSKYMYIDYSTLTTSSDGYTNTSSQKLASMYFQALKPGTVTISADASKSTVTLKSSGLDTLMDIAADNITIAKDTVPPIATISGDFGVTPVTATSSSVTFTWTGVDKPDRAPGVVVPLKYVYCFDLTPCSAYTTETTITKTLTNGQHRFFVNATDPSGNHQTCVYNGDHPDNTCSRTFTLNLTPSISSISPTSGQTGTQVTVNGYNFGATRGTALIKFGTKVAATADYVSWSDTKIVVKVPAGANGDITVVRGTLASNAITFSLGTMFDILFNLAGITKDSGPKHVTVSIKRTATGAPQTFTNVEATWDATNKAYSAIMGSTASFTTASTYIIAIKETSRLQKVFKNITLTSNANNIVKKTAAADTLPIGDFDTPCNSSDPNCDYNKFTTHDIGLILSKYTAISVPATGDIAPFDLNGDGVLDTGDIGLLLSKYTKLETDGDAF